MSYVVGFLIDLLLLPIFLGWLMIVLGPVFVPIATFFFLYLASKEEAYRTVDLNYNLDVSGAPELEPNLVLVVDDEFASVLPLIKLLEHAKVPFKYVKSGVEAVNELSRRHFRLIFMDLYMPKMTGFETLTQADRLMGPLTTSPTPVVLYSGKDLSEASQPSLRNLSIVDRWNKSMNLQNLWYQLNHLLVSLPS